MVMRPIVAAVALVIVASSSAQADRQLGARVGLGVTGYHDGPSPVQFGPGLQLDVAYRFKDGLTAGIHFGITRYTYTFLDGNMEPEDNFEAHMTSTPFQLGVGTQWSSDLVLVCAVGWTVTAEA